VHVSEKMQYSILNYFIVKQFPPSKHITNDFLGASKEFGKSRTM
jgi:hypothetical protein